jgi:hypothetical protein
MTFVTIQNNKIVALDNNPFITDVSQLMKNQKQISAEIAAQLIRLPADFTLDVEGNITTVTPAPEPDPEPALPTAEERLAATEAAILVLMGV